MPIWVHIGNLKSLNADIRTFLYVLYILNKANCNLPHNLS